MKQLCLRRRRHVELATQDIATALVLLQRQAAASLRRVEAHQAAMHIFLQRVETKQPVGRTDGLVEPSGPLVVH